MIELRSDTFTLPTEEMLEAIPKAALGDDIYGEDPTVKQLEQLAAEMLGKEAAIFMPSGTMANLASLMAHCPRGSKVLVGNETDIYIYEAAGASVCGGIMYEPIPTQPDGTLLIEDLAKAFPDDTSDPQFALPSLITIENPHNRMGGKVLPLSYLEEVHQFAASKGLPVHMDGARIFNAAIALGVPVCEVAQYADSIQFCLSKGLSAPVGSMVVGTAEFIEKVYRLRKMLGGGMRQSGLLAAAGIIALEKMVDRLADDHANARRLAQGLSQIEGIEVDMDVPTNIVFFRVTAEGYTWQRFVEECRQAGLNIAELGHGRIRAVTHSGVTTEDIDTALDIIRHVLSKEEVLSV
ncbi:low-specificity L-threonine aldolase [Tumebacillus algifaecis]|uniref:Low-specificity L-threonine aldolase n=1 Tax=Tumebacillus algifaecis TaxID=1214604 RepID=A0A223CY19_9BACL|nr:low-specificity L-threonine aldolase [Tumebacillus algifaecis]ASS74135.1 low-specificity L-threonine aldolase [Tumebacillus algifaecis]